MTINKLNRITKTLINDLNEIDACSYSKDVDKQNMCHVLSSIKQLSELAGCELKIADRDCDKYKQEAYFIYRDVYFHQLFLPHEKEMIMNGEM